MWPTHSCCIRDIKQKGPVGGRKIRRMSGQRGKEATKEGGRMLRMGGRAGGREERENEKEGGREAGREEWN